MDVHTAYWVMVVLAVIPMSLFLLAWISLSTSARAVRILLLPMGDPGRRFQQYRPTDTSWFSPTSPQTASSVCGFIRSILRRPGFCPEQARIRVSDNGGGAPLWRKDGRELFYVTPDGRLMSVDVKCGPRLETGVPKVLFKTSHSPSYSTGPEG